MREVVVNSIGGAIWNRVILGNSVNRWNSKPGGKLSATRGKSSFVIEPY